MEMDFQIEVWTKFLSSDAKKKVLNEHEKFDRGVWLAFGQKICNLTEKTKKSFQQIHIQLFVDNVNNQTEGIVIYFWIHCILSMPLHLPS